MLDLLPSDDQQQIIDGARAILADKMPVDRLRTQEQGDPATAAWRDLVDFGWFLLGLPEQAGGLGLTLVEEMMLAREAGRSLLPPSVLATTLAGHVAAAADGAALVEALGSGAARAGFAIALPETAGAWLLLDAAEATHTVCLDRDEVKLFAAEDFVERQRVAAIDETASLEKAVLRPSAGAFPGSPELARRAVVLLAANLVGLAEAAQDLAVEYAKVREQFGRPIGGFQAIKHRCADMCVRAEIAGAQVSMAALSEVEGLGDAGFQIWAAALSALDAARENGAACIQVHGGMGFTWECHAHRYMKRAQLLTQLLGGARAVESRLLEQVSPTL